MEILTVKYGESVFKVMATLLSRSAKLSNQWRTRWQVFKFFSCYPPAGSRAREFRECVFPCRKAQGVKPFESRTLRVIRPARSSNRHHSRPVQAWLAGRLFRATLSIFAILGVKRLRGCTRTLEILKTTIRFRIVTQTLNRSVHVNCAKIFREGGLRATPGYPGTNGLSRYKRGTRCVMQRTDVFCCWPKTCL
jgi:hypothetical protein